MLISITLPLVKLEIYNTPSLIYSSITIIIIKKNDETEISLFVASRLNIKLIN